MPIPKFEDFLEPFLYALADQKEHSAQEVKKAVATKLALSAQDLELLLPSGTQSVLYSRTNWAGVYLRKAGLITSPLRSHYQITAEGLVAVQSGEKINLPYLKRFQSFLEFYQSGKKHEPDRTKTPAHPELTPEEMLKSTFAEITATLAGDLLEEIMKLSSTDFEKLVLKLLEKMGYGGGLEAPGIVTQASHDEGIDFVIKEDQLGFSSIYGQAKQWDPKRTVDRPEIQKFAGALQGQQAQKGVFITTATFTAGARAFVSKINSKIVLIDGSQLTRLMIRHNLGVSVTDVYEIKRIDSDFFTDFQDN